MRKVGGNRTATLSFLESCKDQLLEAEEITQGFPSLLISTSQLIASTRTPLPWLANLCGL